MLHATSEVELGEIRAQGFTAPVVVVPNGIDLPAISPDRSVQATKTRTLLYLSRIHPIKGLDRLLRAWVDLQEFYPDWRLVIAGRGELSHVQEVHELAVALGVKRVEFPGPLYGEAKSQAYFGADVFVLPTHSENFGMVVAEALAHGCPTLVSRGAPWHGVVSERCGWWVSNDVPSLVEALRTAMSLSSEELSAMGSRGRAWMERDYGWDAIAHKMNAAYRWLLLGGTRPACVHVD